MNIRADFYNRIAERLTSIVDESDAPVIKHFDFWNNQYNDDFREVFAHPAVFLHIKEMSWQSTGKHRQLGQMEFDLHIASSTKAKSAFDRQFTNRWLAHLEMIDTIHYWLAGWQAGPFGSLQRIRSQHDDLYGDIIKHVETYRCTAVDVAAMRTYTRQLGDKLVITLKMD